MTRSIVFRIVSALVLVAAIVGLGAFAFRAGFIQGAAANIQLPAGEPGGLPYPHYSYGLHPFGFRGFDCFGLLIPLFLLFLAFGAFRRMLWGPRWGCHMHHRGLMGYGPWGEGVPPMFAEWHRRAHGEKTADEKTE